MTAGAKRASRATTSSMSHVYWRCSQVSYAFRPEQIVVGLRVAKCEHAMREYRAIDLPKISRFHVGTVTRISGETMTITYDDPVESGCISTTCGIKEYACYCVPVIENPSTEKPKRSKVKK